MNIEDIRKEAKRLENGGTTWNNCERLAILYTILNYNQEPNSDDAVTVFSDTHNKQLAHARNSMSEFVRAAETAPYEHMLDIMDEHMEAIRLVYPLEYKHVINRLKSFVKME